MEANPFDLQRFVSAQAGCYDEVVAELAAGEKRSHWMWFIFPQLDGLGHSAMARRYAIKSRAETQAYLQHPLLGSRLAECCRLLLDCDNPSISAIMGYPDDLKLKSSMTLFAAVSPAGSVFQRVLDKYYGGEADTQTLRLLDAGAAR